MKTVLLIEVNHNLETVRSHLEKRMNQLNPKASPNEHRFYLGGCIDTFAETGVINEEERETLWTEFFDMGNHDRTHL